MVNTTGGMDGSHAPGERPGPPAQPAFPLPAQPPTEPEAGPDGAERPSPQPERPGYERRPHVRFFAIYGLFVGAATTCLALLFALVIDSEPDLDGLPDTPMPSAWPSGVPTDIPTELPSDFPTDWLTAVPTYPTDYPTDYPTGFPTDFLTDFPTDFPTIDLSYFSDFPTDEWTLPTELLGESPEAP